MVKPMRHASNTNLKPNLNSSPNRKAKKTHLFRHLTLWAVIAAAMCNVIGGGINYLIVSIQNEVPGIGTQVPLAMMIAGAIALVVALLHASISTALPRAGGEYLYISRGLSPFFGFIGAFLKLMGAIISLGTVAYMDVFILKDALLFANLKLLAAFMNTWVGQIVTSLSFIWIFWGVNMLGVKKYKSSVLFLASIMVIGGIFIVYTGLTHTTGQFVKLVGISSVSSIAHAKNIVQSTNIFDLIKAITFLFWAYIGFTSIAQSGGEIEDPKKNMPRAFILTAIIITLYYAIYAFSLYHAVPWQYMVGSNNMTVPGLIAKFLPQSLAILVTLFVLVALANDIPPMLYTKSRLMYSWAVDGILPKAFSKTNKHGVPSLSLTTVTIAGSLVAIGCVAGGFFTEVNVVVFSAFIVYILLAMSLIAMKKRNPKIYKNISFMKNRTVQVVLSSLVILIVLGLSVVSMWSDLSASRPWYEYMTVQTLILIVSAIIIYYVAIKRMKRMGINYNKIFLSMPPE